MVATVYAEETRIEVGSPRNGRPGYRWTTGYYVIFEGRKQYPPIQRRDVRHLAEQLAGPKCKVVYL